MTKNKLIIAGPTASGKSHLAIELAKQLGGEIINADSIAVYKNFDIGAAKPSKIEMEDVPHHLFNLFDWHQECDAGLYAKLAHEKIFEIEKRGKLPIVVGGTGLYIRALLGESFHDLPHDPKIRSELTSKSKEELYELLSVNDPDRAAEIHPNDHFRLARSLEIFYVTGKTLKELTTATSTNRLNDKLFIALEPSRDTLLEKIERRTRIMLKKGLVNEVMSLVASGVCVDSKPMKSIGYKEVVEFLTSNSIFENPVRLRDVSYDQWQNLEEKIFISTRQFARKQTTWFKKVDKDLHLTTWSNDQVVASVKALITEK